EIPSLHEPYPLIPSFSPVGEKVPGGRLRGIPTGSWSQCMRKQNERGLSMNHGLFGVPPPGGSNRLDRRKPGLQAVTRFMVPMHGHKTVEAFHEPTVWCSGFSRSGPPEGGTPNKLRPPSPRSSLAGR